MRRHLEFERSKFAPVLLAAILIGAPPLSADAPAPPPPVSFYNAWREGLGKTNSCTVLKASAQSQDASDAARRAALVIGNANYVKADWALANPHNDAVAVARFLQRNGFDVYVVLDGGQSAIEACAAELAAGKSDIAMLYYSGHGVQFEYANYLMGADAATLDRSLKGFVSLDGLISKLRSNAAAMLVFLDACRDNPLSASSVPGLAPEQVAPKSAASAKSVSAEDDEAAVAATPSSSLSAGELFVAFATSPNSTASDGGGSFSPFTESFLRHAGRPGWLVQRVVAEVTKEVGEATDWRQTPWSRSSLTREIYFNGAVDPGVAKRASDLKASESAELLGKGAKQDAILRALEGLPERYDEKVPETYPAAYEALWRAVRSRSLQLPVNGPVHAAFSFDGRRIATVSAEVGDAGRKDGLVLWDRETGAQIAELLPVERAGTTGETLYAAQFSRDGKVVMHIDPSAGSPVVWDAETGAVLKTLPKKARGSGKLISLPKFQFAPSGKLALFSGGDKNGVELVDVETGQTRWRKGSSFGGAAGFGPDETIVVIVETGKGGGGGPSKELKVEAFAVESGKQIWSYRVAEESWGAYKVNFAPDGGKIGITTSSEHLIVVDTATGEATRVQMPRSGSAGYAFSPDGSAIAVISSDQSETSIELIDLASGKNSKPGVANFVDLDRVHQPDGTDVGLVWFDDAGDIWRKPLLGAELFEAANAALDEARRTALSGNRVQFR